MAQTRIESDVFVAGAFRSTSLSIPAGTVTNSGIAADADVATTKLQHRTISTYAQSGNATAVTIPIHRVYGTTGTIIAIHAGSIGVATSDAAVTVDLKKNGTTCLSGVITLDSGNTARIGEAGTLTVTSLAAGDLLELVVTAAAGGGALPTGLFVTTVIDEKAA